MEEARFNNLCSHYKDSFDIHSLTIKRRDTLFYSLLVILAVFTLQISSAEAVANFLSDSFDEKIGVSFGNNLDFMATLMWLSLLGFSTRYFQVVLEIERQYSYLHVLEKELNDYYQNSKAFTREGKSYLSKYPLFSNWVYFLYTVIFPCLILFLIVVRIRNDVAIMSSIELNQIINIACFFMIGLSSILYICRLHESAIEDFFKWCSEKFLGSS